MKEYDFKVGDIVARKSYNSDIYFKVLRIVDNGDGHQTAELHGLDVRLRANSPLEDLIKVNGLQIKEYRTKFINENNECLRRIISKKSKGLKSLKRAQEGMPSDDFFEMPGRVLHLDGNPNYLSLCMSLYEHLEIKAIGIHVPEAEQPVSVPSLIRIHGPDILILTGHDGILKDSESFTDLGNYHNSKYFVQAVEAARQIECNRDNLIVFAGACQSCYEAIISAGANYASAPRRVLIHAFDPVFIVHTIAFTPINEIISVNEVIDSTITGKEGIGGIDTKGKYRRGFPKSHY